MLSGSIGLNLARKYTDVARSWAHPLGRYHVCCVCLTVVRSMKYTAVNGEPPKDAKYRPESSFFRERDRFKSRDRSIDVTKGQFP